jgi:hypothetical protein
MVGVVVKVGEGTVGVKVDAAVGVFVKVGVGVEAGGLPRIWSMVIEQADSRKTKIRRKNFFFI